MSEEKQKKIGFKNTNDGGLIIHPDIVGDTSTSVNTATSLKTSGFGDSITDQARATMASREPICHFLTFIVASDMLDKWFSVDDPDTETADPALDRGCQRFFNTLHFKTYLRTGLISAFTFGRSLLVGGFNDAKTTQDLMKPKALNAQLMQLDVYPEIYQCQKVKEFEVVTVDLDPASTRYGKPLMYKVTRTSLNESGQQTSSTVYIHWTRVCEVGDGTSVLDVIWDDMTCGRNIRWAVAQALYRMGSGFPVLSFPEGTTPAELQAFAANGAFNNLMSKTYIMLVQNHLDKNDGITIDFKGASGVRIDPTPFQKQNIEQMSIATAYPQAKLIGAQAGAVTGSEVNQQEYYKGISRQQINYCEDPIRWVIKCGVDGGQISQIKATVDKTASNYHLRLVQNALKRVIRGDYRHKTVEDYAINWNDPFQLSALSKADVRLKNSQAALNELNYKTVDEIRVADNMEPLPNGEGAHLRTPAAPQLPQQPQPEETPQSNSQPEEPAQVEENKEEPTA